MLRPLKPGDKVDVVAPGFRSENKDVLRKATEFLNSWGLVARIPQDLFGSHFLHANSDEIRLKHLIQALSASDSAAIWCLRGGYGANRLLPALDAYFSKKQNKEKIYPAKIYPAKIHPKWFLGISDITSLHLYLVQKQGLFTLHAPLLDRMALGQLPGPIASQIKSILFDPGQTELVFKLKGPRSPKIKGVLVGGNLTVLQSTIGTPWQVQLKNKILFVEDIGERAYRVDRVLEHFRQAGLFKGLKALVFGQFIGGLEPDKTNKMPDLIRRWSKDLDCPVFAGLEVGHSEWQWPIPIGLAGEIENGRLSCWIKKKS